MVYCPRPHGRGNARVSNGHDGFYRTVFVPRGLHSYRTAGGDSHPGSGEFTSLPARTWPAVAPTALVRQDFLWLVPVALARDSECKFLLFGSGGAVGQAVALAGHCVSFLLSSGTTIQPNESSLPGETIFFAISGRHSTRPGVGRVGCASRRYRTDCPRNATAGLNPLSGSTRLP